MEGMESEHLKVKLERLYLKEACFIMHDSTLSKYWKNKKIPPGGPNNREIRWELYQTMGRDFK